MSGYAGIEKVLPHFEGTIRIEWRAAGPSGPDIMPGWHFAIRDTDGQAINTVEELTIHADAESRVWAECRMFADPDGKPVYGGGKSTQIHLDEARENILTGTFAFQVASMSVV